MSLSTNLPDIGLERHLTLGEGQQGTNLGGIGFTIPVNRNNFPGLETIIAFRQ